MWIKQPITHQHVIASNEATSQDKSALCMFDTSRVGLLLS